MDVKIRSENWILDRKKKQKLELTDTQFLRREVFLLKQKFSETIQRELPIYHMTEQIVKHK